MKLLQSTSISLLLAFIGFVDASYLTYEHFQNTIPPCTANSIFDGCGKVLQSEYSVVFGIPLALIGTFHYFFFLITIYLSSRENRTAQFVAIILSTTGFLSSLYFAYLQLFVLHAICTFCMVSALTSTFLFVLIQKKYRNKRIFLLLQFFGIFYKYIIKRFLFLWNPETIHTVMVRSGELLGKIAPTGKHNPLLKQRVAGITFYSPIGLAAGFDYEARLTQVLPSIGFGFETVGTITNSPYQGNPKPMLGRLPKSKSLMVNKGFKNLGAPITVKKLEKYKFKFPIGISIGRTNTKDLVTQKQSIDDIVTAFKICENSRVKHAYYELNISCPNLMGDITFYPKENLEELLVAIDKLKLTRPLFIKMPIEKSNAEILTMLKVISKHSPAGVIFGNLQKDRKHPQLIAGEVAQFPVGNFSGKPTFDRSNELISLAYRHYGKRFIIIGCGGVFSAQDAYEKIIRGATLVQLITGMIFEGPQLISQINTGLVDLMERNGYDSITEVIGSKSRTNN